MWTRLWRGIRSFRRRPKSRSRRARVRNVHPYEIVLLLARIAAGVYAIDFEVLVCGKRGNDLTLSVVNVELPAMISALEIFAVETAAVEGHTAMRAGIAQRKGLSGAVPSNHQRNFEQRCLVQLIPMNLIAGQSAVPEAGEHERVGGLALGKIEFGHRDC